MKTHIHRKFHTQKFTEALFIRAPKERQLKCPLAEECLSKMWSIIWQWKRMKY
jgi:hypothetical protein